MPRWRARAGSRASGARVAVAPAGRHAVRHAARAAMPSRETPRLDRTRDAHGVGWRYAASSFIRTVTVGPGISPGLLTPLHDGAGARGLSGAAWPRGNTAGGDFHPALRIRAGCYIRRARQARGNPGRARRRGHGRAQGRDADGRANRERSRARARFGKVESLLRDGGDVHAEGFRKGGSEVTPRNLGRMGGGYPPGPAHQSLCPTAGVGGGPPIRLVSRSRLLF